MQFSEEIKLQVWHKALAVDGYDPSMFRKDACGAWMIYNKYGLRDNNFGWEIDHVLPVSLGGNDNIRNLRAMHWRNNESKGNDYPSYIARVTSEGNTNVDCYNSHTVNASLRKFIEQQYNK